MAAPPQTVLRFSHVVAPDTPKGQMAKRFQHLVEQQSGGRIRVEVYPDSQLYGDKDELEALHLGAVEMLAPSLSKLGGAGAPEFELFDLPFLFDSLTQVQCVTQGHIGKNLLKGLSRQQVVGLGYLNNGFKQMSGHRPLRQSSDFKGLKIRTQNSRVVAAQMRALGAHPVVLPFDETQQALAHGIVDGAENPLSNFLTQGLAPTQKVVTLTDHGYLGYAVIVNQKFWQSLNATDRRMVHHALNQALQEANARSVALNSRALLELRNAKDLTVERLSEAERDHLRHAVKSVHTDFERRHRNSLLQEVKKHCTSLS